MGEDILPTVDYPPMIRGSLRLMLQLKDAFLGSFNLVEEYRDQLLACKHGFTRDLVEYQLTKGLAAITRLREDLSNVESQVRARINRNVALRQYILQRYGMTSAGGVSAGIVSRIGGDADGDPNHSGTGTAVLGPALPPPISAPDSVEQALHGGLNHHKMEINVDKLDIPPEIDLATATTESGTHLLPVVDFYRGFFFLQMHFQLIMCQAANYAMPVVTRPMSLSERTFSWPTMPSFGLAATSGSMKDRLLEINTDVVALAKRLHDCLGLVREKMVQDRKIESYFMQHTAAQEAVQRSLLRGLQSQRVYIELLESQNDRLAGLAIKLDPNFAKSSEFALMTGPGMPFPDTGKSEPKLTSNQNSAVTNAKRRFGKSYDRKPGDEDRRKGGGSSGGQAKSHETSTDFLHNPYLSQNQDTERTRGYSTGNDHRQPTSYHHEDSESEPSSTGEIPISDVNFSASGGGNPAIWVQQGTLTSRGHSKMRPVDVDVELTGKLGDLRGHSQAVEHLLIGMESFTQGRRKRGNEQHLTSSFLNTEHHVPSIVDDVLGQDPTMRKSLTPPKPPSNRTRFPHLHTPSTQISIADPMSPAESVDQPVITVLSPNSEQSGKSTASGSMVNRRQMRLHKEDYSEQDDTLSAATPSAQCFSPSGQTAHGVHTTAGATNQLNTNVNSSHVLPAIVMKDGRVRPRLSRTALPYTSASEGIKLGINQKRTSHYTNDEETEFHDPGDSHSDAPVKEAYTKDGALRQLEEHHLRQVPTVGTAECGHLCIPEWIAHRGSGKTHKSDDLLAEPKRSAFNKAVMAHRCRLVETILQADEDRLEELISVLLRD